jgi:hypothetical protein
MGLLDEILKQLEEAQGQAPRRPQPRPVPNRQPRPEREMDEDGAEWEEDEEARPSHAPHIPDRRVAAAYAAEPAPVPQAEPERRTVTSSAPAAAPHALGAPPAVRIRAMITNRSGIRDALIAREILGPPPGLRMMRRR